MAQTEKQGYEEAELLQLLIRNACVNTGTRESGQEIRNARVLDSYLSQVPGIQKNIIEAEPGRANLIARWGVGEGPTLALLAHTDVVPANPDGWEFDPFSGEIRDGYVHGRGSVDMLNLASSMATSIVRLAESGFQPRGTLLFLAVADEEAGGKYGTGYLTTKHTDEIRADYVLTEWGGVRYRSAEQPQFAMITGEKGVAWVRVTVKGRSAHGSRPYGADNALIAAGRFITELANKGASVSVSEEWQRLVDRLDLSEDLHKILLDPSRIDEALPKLDSPFDAFAHACTRMTFSPTVLRSGEKTNVIPDKAEIELDVRTIPGQTTADVLKLLKEISVAAHVDAEFDIFNESIANSSAIDTPLWKAMEQAVDEIVPGGKCVPAVTTGGNDARFYRAMGATAYGGGLLSSQFTFKSFISVFHGPNERIDLESLALSTEFFSRVARLVVG